MLAAALLGAAALASAGRDAEQSACPAFSHAASPYACTCEIAQNSGCRGVTPRFNWIIGLCDEPEPDEPKPDRAHGKLTPAGGYQCADPMRVNDDRPLGGPRAEPSNVQLRYIAAYQWGNPCEVALDALCNGTAHSGMSGCSACVTRYRSQLLAGYCTEAELGKACSTCGLALRSASRTYRGRANELCGSLDRRNCEFCISDEHENQRHLMEARCYAADLTDFCSRRWTLVPPSSVNTDGSAELVDLPALEQPGGADLWTRGVYMPNVAGLGPPGILFVISCKVCSQFAWFMVNQATLDRGPDHAKPTCSPQQGNCWASASAGEIDFLETGFWDPNSYNTSLPDGSPNPNLNNSRHYVTGYNGAGRCMPVNNGIKAEGSVLPPKDAGGICSTNFFVDDGAPHVYAAVVDRRGATVYRDPSWLGLTATTAAPTLEHAAPAKPERLTPPCLAGTGSCALNTPACLTDKERNRDLPTPPTGQPDCLGTSTRTSAT